MATPQEWLDSVSRVPSGDEEGGPTACDFSWSDDPELYDAAEHYLDLRDDFADAADALAKIMFARGWSAR
jgi:hypothetical protein